MKKIKPVSRYDSDDGYPAVTTDAPDRRGFLKVALAGTAALGGSVLLGGQAASRRKSKYHHVTIRLHGHYQYYPCRYRAESLFVQTKSSRFAKFLGDAKEQRRAEQALAKILRAAKCTDVQDAKKLAKMHKKLARALVVHYRKRTRRRVTQPIVTLALRRIRRIPVPGGIRRPPRPPRPVRPTP